MQKIYLCENADNINNVFGSTVKKELGCEERIFSKKDVMLSPSDFFDTEYIFSTWGMPEFSPEEIGKCFPKLKCIFYAAGTVKDFALPFLKCGVKIFSAWAANAVPVAEYTLAQILLSAKGYFPSAARYGRGDMKAADLKRKYKGNYNIKVGIIGAGMIGRKVIELLKPFKAETMVFDPFLSDEQAVRLGTAKATLEELFSKCDIVSNHLADKPQTKGILNYKLFSSMKPYSTFINTGRGAQVNENDLIKTLEERSDIYALLDVTYPEPPDAGSKLFSLENCILTPHIAGSIGNEVSRMAEYMLEEYRNFEDGFGCRYEVTENMLATMA